MSLFFSLYVCIHVCVRAHACVHLCKLACIMVCACTVYMCEPTEQWHCLNHTGTRTREETQLGSNHEHLQHLQSPLRHTTVRGSRRHMERRDGRPNTNYTLIWFLKSNSRTAWKHWQLHGIILPSQMETPLTDLRGSWATFWLGRLAKTVDDIVTRVQYMWLYIPPELKISTVWQFMRLVWVCC